MPSKVWCARSAYLVKDTVHELMEQIAWRDRPIGTPDPKWISVQRITLEGYDYVYLATRHISAIEPVEGLS